MVALVAVTLSRVAYAALCGDTIRTSRGHPAGLSPPSKGRFFCVHILNCRATPVATHMNCTSIVGAYEEAFEHVNAHASTNSVILGLVLLGASLPLLVYGYKTFLPATSLLAGLVVSWLVLRATEGSDCTARVTMTVVGSIAAVVLCVCLLNKALFVLGAGAFGATAHYMYDVLPIVAPEAWGGRSIYYWATVAVASAVGGVAVCCNKDEALIISTAVVGACALTGSVFALASPPAWVAAPIIAPSAAASVVVQHHIRRRADARRQDARHDAP